jgi:hypothetical protein
VGTGSLFRGQSAEVKIKVKIYLHYPDISPLAPIYLHYPDISPLPPIYLHYPDISPLPPIYLHYPRYISTTPDISPLPPIYLHYPACAFMACSIMNLNR